MSEQRYPMAPLIRFTLVSLYFALVFPLPWLAPRTRSPTTTSSPRRAAR